MVIVCMRGRTVDDGTVLRWYRTERAAEENMPMIWAHRRGIHLAAHLRPDDVPLGVRAAAEGAHAVLRHDPRADMGGWATHRHHDGALTRTGSEARYG